MSQHMNRTYNSPQDPLTELLREGEKVIEDRSQKLDCGDNSCLFAENKTGMRTNGGCRCFAKHGFHRSPVSSAIKMLPIIISYRKVTPAARALREIVEVYRTMTEIVEIYARISHDRPKDYGEIIKSAKDEIIEIARKALNEK